MLPAICVLGALGCAAALLLGRTLTIRKKVGKLSAKVDELDQLGG